MKDNVSMAHGVTESIEPVTIHKYVYEGRTYRDGKQTGWAKFEVCSGHFSYKDETGDVYEGEILDTNKCDFDGFDYGLNVEGVEVDDDADSWELRWYAPECNAMGDMTVYYSPAFRVLVVITR